MKKQFRYIPAFHYRWLMRWYDPMMRLFFTEEALKTVLIAQAHIQPAQNVLDVGCGTGTSTLTLQIKQTQPNATVYGLDVDPQVLDITRRKAEQAGETIIRNRVARLACPIQMKALIVFLPVWCCII